MPFGNPTPACHAFNTTAARSADKEGPAILPGGRLYPYRLERQGGDNGRTGWIRFSLHGREAYHDTVCMIALLPAIEYHAGSEDPIV